MKIILSYAGGKNNEHTITHDLNFQQEKYEAEHNVVGHKQYPLELAAFTSLPTQ